jgi:hypothetical protein
MGIVLVSQAHSASRADLGNGIDGVSNLRVNSAKDCREGEIVGGGQLLAPACQTR